MSNDFTTYGDVTFKKYEDERQGDGLTRIQWRNGEQRSKTGGYFFLPGDRLPEGFAPGEPWVTFTDTFDDGTEVEGFKAEVLNIAIIGVRQQPFVRDAAGVKTWLPKGKYAKGTQGAGIQVDVLCAAEGLTDLGPVVWASSTIKTSFAIIERVTGILQRLKIEVVKEAETIANRELRPWCFWAQIATERDAQNKIVYTATQGKAVTRPVLVLPSKVDKAYLIKVATGKDFAIWGEEMRGTYEDWLKEERTNDVQPAAKSNGKNVPQEVDDTDLPF